MPGQFDLGYDGDIPVRRIFDDVADLVLRIISAVFGAVVARARRVADDRTAAAGADFREQGITFDFNAPALVLRKVPVEVVHFMQRDKIDIAFDEFDGEEMSADVQMKPAPRKAGVVDNVDAGDGKALGSRGFLVWGGLPGSRIGAGLRRRPGKRPDIVAGLSGDEGAEREQLDQGLDTVKDTGAAGGGDVNMVAGGIEAVVTFLNCRVGRESGEVDIVNGGIAGTGYHSQPKAVKLCEVVIEELDTAFVAGIGDDNGVGIEIGRASCR